jgi:hypothetical protein
MSVDESGQYERTLEIHAARRLIGPTRRVASSARARASSSDPTNSMSEPLVSSAFAQGASSASV